MRTVILCALSAAALLGYVARRSASKPWDLRGRTVLVTGASRGLGLQLCRELAPRGVRIVMTSRDAEDLSAAAQQIESLAEDVTHIACDIRDPKQVASLIDTVRDTYGGIDILVNNAGIIDVGPLNAMDERSMAAALDTMLWGQYHVTSAALPDLRRSKGRIVNITSIGGRVSVPHLIPYSCAKSASLSLSEGLTAALARDGVKVCTVVPGLMRTGSHLRANFRGSPYREYSWFSLAASFRPISMDPSQAARHIVAGLRKGRSHVTLTTPAKLASYIHGLAPGVTTRTLGLVERFLPQGRHEPPIEGLTIHRFRSGRVLSFLTRNNRRSGDRLNQMRNRA